MIYTTVMMSPMYRQMTIDELFFGGDDVNTLITTNYTNTKTYESELPIKKIADKTNISNLILTLCTFNNRYEDLRVKENRHELYREFRIPKHSGGLRKISAPNYELMGALRELKKIFEVEFHALYHTSAFAYIKKRSTIDAIKRHQSNESKWFGKYDLHDFFGSTNKEFVMKMFGMVYPFSEVIKTNRGKEELSKALDLAFLDGGLPQGTPISPTITNIMMIPIDFKLYKEFRDHNKQSFVYTRYADDFLISSRYDFDFKEVSSFIIDTLKEFDAPFSLNTKKTRYGSNAGSNWNLGVMLNKDNEITVGHKKKRQFKAMLCSYILDRQHGNPWSGEDIQAMEGLRSYYHMVEPKQIDDIINHTNEKFSVDVVAMLREDIADISRGTY